MPRNSSGVYTLANSAFQTQTTIASGVMNGDLNDIATALTQSLASTGVTPMTGPVLGASGTVTAPGYTFNSAQTTGFYLAGTNQIGWASAGVQGATFNNDKSVTWAGNQSIGGTLGVTGATTLSAALTLNGTSYTFGAGAGSPFITALAPNYTIEYVIDGFGSVLTTGQKGFVEAPCAGTIKRMTLVADQSGSCVVDIWKVAYGSFPPSSGNSITASDIPTLSSAQNTQDSSLSGWTTTVNAGDILAYNVNSATTVTRVTLSLLIQRTGL